jgi:hypothetical protein
MTHIIASYQHVINTDLDPNRLRPSSIRAFGFSCLLHLGFVGMCLMVASGGWAGEKLQAGGPPQSTPIKTATEKQFADLVAALADAPLDDAPKIEKLEQAALKMLDAEVQGALPATPGPALDALNSRLARFTSSDSELGESYRVIPLAGQPPVYALIANFGLGAPSAVRLYAEEGIPTHFSMAARIDRSTQQDFLDDSLDLLPVTAPGIIFITIVGRTDAEQTGVFTAWQFEAPRSLKQLWTSDLLQQSSYQMDASGFQLTYCNNPDEDKPGACKAMVRERYRWDDGQWRKVESTPVPVPKR